MKTHIALALMTAFALSACENYTAPANLAHEDVGIWVSPQGCDSWYFEDGISGFMSPRLNAQGKPVCSGAKLPPKAN